MNRPLTALLLVGSCSLAVPLPCAAQSSDDTPAVAPAAPVADSAPASSPPEVAQTTLPSVEPVGDPPAQAPREEPVATTVPVTLTTADERVLLHRTDDSAQGRRELTLLCRLPCTAELAPGAYRFGATRGGGDPSAISDVVEIDGPGEWNVRFSDNSGLRDAGGLIMVLGGIAGALGPVLAVFVFPKTIATASRSYTTINTELMLAFVFPGAAAMITGLLLALFSYDGVTVDETGVRF